ncbi:unnamed protein product, partial [marine sediment metagenome]
MIALSKLFTIITDKLFGVKEAMDETGEATRGMGADAQFLEERYQKLSDQLGFQIANINELNEAIKKGRAVIVDFGDGLQGVAIAGVSVANIFRDPIKVEVDEGEGLNKLIGLTKLVPGIMSDIDAALKRDNEEIQSLGKAYQTFESETRRGFGRASAAMISFLDIDPDITINAALAAAKNLGSNFIDELRAQKLPEEIAAIFSKIRIDPETGGKAIKQTADEFKKVLPVYEKIAESMGLSLDKNNKEASIKAVENWIIAISNIADETDKLEARRGAAFQKAFGDALKQVGTIGVRVKDVITDFNKFLQQGTKTQNDLLKEQNRLRKAGLIFNQSITAFNEKTRSLIEQRNNAQLDNNIALRDDLDLQIKIRRQMGENLNELGSALTKAQQIVANEKIYLAR